ncbi:thioredoxin-dependent thiol peroxidase [Patescibacteria group bacterium]|nr:MAG: thioredoxin-dependent thiol peroxidase [Patescibacteria group bacterium]
MPLPSVGQPAPAFSLQDQKGETHTLQEHAGSWVLLYFYPKDDTPGCTKEACGVRDNFTQFRSLDLTVLGVSTDSVASHKKFADKYALPFTLLADVDKKTVQDYGVWGEKKFMGRTFNGIRRTSFLITPEGKIAKVYENVKADGHAGEVLKDLQELKK